MRVRSPFRDDPAKGVLVVAMVALSVWVLLFATRGFFSGDSGMKLAQAHALKQSTLTTRALPYDWEMDPKGMYFPYGDLVVEIDGQRQGIYSWVFTGATVPLIAALNVHGTVVLPLLGGLLMALGIFVVSRRTGYGAVATSAAIVVSLFLTPVLLYCSQYAEHSLAAGLIVLAIGFAVPRAGVASDRGRPLVSGILVGLAATVRPEAYCAVASLGVALALGGGLPLRERVRVSALYLAGCVPVLLIFWGVNHVSADTWDLAFHRNKNRSASMKGALTMLIGDIKQANAGAWVAMLGVPLGIGLAPERFRRGWIRLSLHLAAGGMLCWLAWRAHGLAQGRTLVGLFAVTPVVAYGLLAGPWNPRTRVAWIAGVGFVIQVLLFDNSGTAGGLQFGARFLLPAVPILVLLAAAVAEDDCKGMPHRALHAVAIAPAVVLVALCALFMWRGLPEAIEIADNGWEATERAIEAPPEVIVTRRWWESQVLAPAILEGKKLYNVTGDVRFFVQRLADSGVEEFVYISKGDTVIPLSNERVARTVRMWSGWLHVQHVRIEPR